MGGMENFFYLYGRTVAKYPFLFVVLCFLITGLSTLGLLQIRMENNGLKLWIPKDSSQRINSDWVNPVYNNGRVDLLVILYWGHFSFGKTFPLNHGLPA